jgi:hypothetical protein
MDNEHFSVVFSHSRAEGVLVDVSEIAREAGFRIPVALALAAWAECVAWGEGDDVRGVVGQSEARRLWDVVFLAAHAARLHRRSGRNRGPFSVLRMPRGGRWPRGRNSSSTSDRATRGSPS